jgi:ribosomal protein S18 acetylase RimI-like enzyme
MRLVGEKKQIRTALDTWTPIRTATTSVVTSRPSREAANRLYQRIGFVRRDTNVYRYEV